MSRLVIYTAITGAKDDFHEPRHRLPETDYVCFTDTPNLRSNIFTFRPLPFSEKDSRRTARRIKLFPHELFPEYSHSLWLDGSKRIRANLSPLIAEITPHPLVALRHQVRVNAFEELEECLLRNRDDRTLLLQQQQAYHAAGLPETTGLWETSMLFRAHTPQNATLMQTWWQELQTYSARDQVSLPYALWKTQTPIHELDFRRWHDPFFLQYPHRWHPKGDHRNHFTAQIHARFWHLIQLFGLQTPYENAIKRVKNITNFRVP